jgi:lipopolysaccharide export system permease protein
VDEVSTLELLGASDALATETGETRAGLLFEAHSRFSQPILAAAAALIGFASLLRGAFSRIGLWRQVIVAVVLLLVVQALSTATTSFAMQHPNGWALTYAAPLLGLGIAVVELWWSQRPKRLRQVAA